MSSADGNQTKKAQTLLVLTALGIVYGDIGTSPLYALRECFHGNFAIAADPINVMGVLSLIFWSLVLVISIKYLQFVMRADNKGEGGVLSLTALACLAGGARKLPIGSTVFLAIGLFGSALLIGDGMITPAISVLSAIEGLNVATPVFENWVMPIAVIILLTLFSVQRFGTDRIGRFFGPIMLLWFVTIGLLGLGQIVQHPHILYALSPHHAFKFLFEHTESTIYVFGTVFLSVTGGEALYADMGHFGRRAITKGWYGCALPALVLNYFGQGALLLADPGTVTNPFFHMAPNFLLYPVVVLAAMAAIIASQAIISGLFSLANQCIQLGYSPRLDIIHTSEQHHGQIYVPFMNWFLMIGTLWIVFEFHTSSNLSAAYGIAISLDMVITTLLAAVVAYRLWSWSVGNVVFVAGSFLILDMVFAVANVIKIEDGGWVPLVIAGCVYFCMTTWKRGREILVGRLRERAYPFKDLLEEIKKDPPARVRGTSIFMVGDSELTPPALLHNLRHNRVLHETVVFLTVVGRSVPHVAEADRVKVFELAPSFYRVIANYGFSDSPDIPTLLAKYSRERLGFEFTDPTYFLGREVLVAGPGRSGEMSYWRKKVFTIMAKNATVAAHFFKLPQQDVIEVGMEIEF